MYLLNKLKNREEKIQATKNPDVVIIRIFKIIN